MVRVRESFPRDTNSSTTHRTPVGVAGCLKGSEVRQSVQSIRSQLLGRPHVFVCFSVPGVSLCFQPLSLTDLVELFMTEGETLPPSVPRTLSRSVSVSRPLFLLSLSIARIHHLVKQSNQQFFIYCSFLVCWFFSFV